MIELYIVRHAIAVPRGTPGYPNDDRPLTPEGIKKMESAAKGIAKVISSVDFILTSPLKRAHHTANIVAEVLGTKSKVKIIEELLPGKTGTALLEALAKLKKTKLMLVGHEPDLSRFASLLLGSPKVSIIQFKKGAMCRIDVESIPLMQPGQIIYHLSPKHLRAIANA